MSLYLTYDNTSLCDGYGAQLLRIFGIYSLATVTMTPYIHSPIVETIEEFAHQTHDQNELDYLTKKVNDFFALPGADLPINFDRVFAKRTMSLREFLKLYLRYHLFSRKKNLLKLVLPFDIINRVPSLSLIAVKQVKKRNFDTFKKHPKLDFVMHVRLGYGQKSKVSKMAPKRFLPSVYYANILTALSQKGAFEGQQDKLVVHTDVSEKRVVWEPTPKRLKQNIDFGEFVYEGRVNVEPTDISGVIPHHLSAKYEIRYCDDFIMTFLDMANSRNLVMSRSAFSYLAALFNLGFVVWPENHGHAKLRKWKSSRRFGVRTDFDLIPG